MPEKKVPHVHAELIKAWADGASIQRYNITLQQWRDCDYLLLDWNPYTKYRVKPEPSPDVVVYQTVKMRPKQQRVVSYIETEERFCTDNVMFVFDGETGKLKDAQVLANE